MKHSNTLRIILSLIWIVAIYAQSNDFASSMQMLQLVNNARIAKNVRPLCISGKLVNAATAHSAYQASINTMTHDGPLSLGDRFVKQGYQPSAVAENVGFTSTPFTQVVFDIWMSSPEHRANILDPNYVHFGAASSVGSNGMYFWTQLFAKPLNPVLEPCDFSAAATAAALTPGQPGFDPNGTWGGSSNYNAYNPNMNPSGNCVSIDNGSGGKTLSCRLTGGANPVANNPPGPVGNYNPALGPNQLGPYNQVGTNPPGYNPPGYNPAGYNPPGSNPPGYNPAGPNPYFNPEQSRNPSIVPPLAGNPSCTVVSTSPSPDGQGSVRVLSCKSTGLNNNNMINPPGPITNPPGVQPVADGSSIIINPEGNFVNPPGYNPAGSNPPGYNPPGYNPPGYNPPGYNPPGYNPPGYNPPGYNPPGYNPPGYNPPGYNSPGSNPPGSNSPGATNGVYSPFWN